MNKHNGLVWEKCEAHPTTAYHTRYRGMDVHQWGRFLCFYPSEGTASEDESRALLERIVGLNLPLGRRLSHLDGVLTRHATCSLTERHDGQVNNYCLEVASIEELDLILDALLEQAGLRRFVVPQKSGMFR